MRDRMKVLMDAFFALDPEPLKILRDNYGVRYLLSARSSHASYPPLHFRYFKPFYQQALNRMEQVRGKEYLFTHEMDNATVFQEGSWVLFDLTKIVDTRIEN